MGDLMRPIPFRELLRRIFAEYSKTDSIFGIHRNDFFKKESGKGIEVFGRSAQFPWGLQPVPIPSWPRILLAPI